jgi:acid phosphatase type 7
VGGIGPRGSPRPARPRAGAAVVLAALLAVACASDSDESVSEPPSTRSSGDAAPAAGATTTTQARRVPDGSAVVAAAGDIACTPGQAPSDAGCRMADTAALVEAAAPAVVLTLGDNQYERGTLDGFQRSYDASWGRFKAITRPSVGNHEYAGGKANGYFQYFGAAAGPAGRGWYSFDLNGWHLVALNSNCSIVGGCGPGSPQHEWLRADLAASDATCTLAYWHHPRFSSGLHGDDQSVGPLWELLEAESAELVLSGHDHHYERFAALAPDGTPDPGGIRQFVVGTGGRSLYPTFLIHRGSEVRRSATYGILVLALSPAGYRWAFRPAPGDTFTDAGEGTCD